MVADLYWIPMPLLPGRLAIAPRPRGGDWLPDEARRWKRAGVDVVVSMLMPDEADALDLAAESDACRAAGLRFVSLPVADRGLPTDRAAFAGLAARLAVELRAGRTVVVHCRQGIGRAGLLAVAVLTSAGFRPDVAIDAVGTARGRPVPETPEQLRWIADFTPAAAAFPEPQPAVAASNAI